jgi:hypothetical protein
MAGELAETGAAHEDVRPPRDCDISRLATLLWRCQASGLAGQVRAIYWIHDPAQCWPDLDRCQEQENSGNPFDIGKTPSESRDTAQRM